MDEFLSCTRPTDFVKVQTGRMQLWNDPDNILQMSPTPHETTTWLCLCVWQSIVFIFYIVNWLCEQVLDEGGFFLLHNVFVLFVTCYLILVPGPLLKAL